MKNFLCKILLMYMSLKLKKYTSDITIIFRYKRVSQSIGQGSKIYDINFLNFFKDFGFNSENLCQKFSECQNWFYEKGKTSRQTTEQ